MPGTWLLESLQPKKNTKPLPNGQNSFFFGWREGSSFQFFFFANLSSSIPINIYIFHFNFISSHKQLSSLSLNSKFLHDKKNQALILPSIMTRHSSSLNSQVTIQKPRSSSPIFKLSKLQDPSSLSPYLNSTLKFSYRLTTLRYTFIFCNN